ncbi:hypothetical protein [Streptomyces sp. NPDC055287]
MADDKFPAALAATVGPDGRTRNYTDTPGYHSVPGATDDGPAATVVVTADMAPNPRALGHADALVDTALCEK